MVKLFVSKKKFGRIVSNSLSYKSFFFANKEVFHFFAVKLGYFNVKELYIYIYNKHASLTAKIGGGTGIHQKTPFPSVDSSFLFQKKG